MSRVINIREVFRSLGQPTATYVSRENGKYEATLVSALNDKGKLSLITGPSKTGKTTLYTRVLLQKQLQPIVVRCDENLSGDEFWRRALEKIDFTRLTSSQTTDSTKSSGTGKIGGTIGWKWLAGLLGEVSVGVESGMGETQIRERILSNPSPDHLIPVLKNLPAVLVVEDFHYLMPSVKRIVFQQWKTFVDGEVSVIVIGTTHHAVDLAYANRDLVGRISQIDLNNWTESDLERIAVQGFEYLKFNVPSSITSAIAREAAALPIIVQDTCHQLLADKGIIEAAPGAVSVQFDLRDVYASLHKVAVTQYCQFDAIYQRLITGPRKRARKYDTYKLVLSTFAQDPLRFSLARHEIDERLSKLPMAPNERPPIGSVTGTLNALAGFQRKNEIELLEWSEKDNRLYILEPAFLFYLRWREQRTVQGTDWFKSLFDTLLSSLRRAGPPL